LQSLPLSDLTAANNQDLQKLLSRNLHPTNPWLVNKAVNARVQKRRTSRKAGSKKAGST
jgi:hypothetical protein